MYNYFVLIFFAGGAVFSFWLVGLFLLRLRRRSLQYLSLNFLNFSASPTNANICSIQVKNENENYFKTLTGNQITKILEAYCQFHVALFLDLLHFRPSFHENSNGDTLMEYASSLVHSFYL